MAKYIHAENMALYAQDAQETETPWDRWQILINGKWEYLDWCFTFRPEHKYRRKPKMLSVTLANGETVSWPEPHRTELGFGDSYFYVGVDGSVIVGKWDYLLWDSDVLSNGYCHLTREAANQHAAALRKINTQGQSK